MRRRILGTVLLIIGLVAKPSGFALAEEQTNHKPDPKTLVDKVVKTYRGVNAYQDTGVVEQAMNQGAIKYRFTKTFSIAFKRPGRLRFEWTDTRFGGEKDHHVLCCDGQETYSYWEHLQQYKHDPDLQTAIAAATGVSGGAAHTIPGLLLERKAWGTSILSVLNDLILLPDETFENVPCYVVAGRHPGGMECKYWIGRGDYLIRKMEQTTASLRQAVDKASDSLKRAEETGEVVKALEQVKDGSVLTREIHRDIEIDKEIPDESFRFVPPEGARLVEEFKVGP